ncbi:universal stress protein [Constantimarinum furrinae]|uniref:Universal stress protein n=1 Tax=Constantimarinum furrinae TaxID=2562285 RepID=A0A7G8PXK7_9FLAO|nr:universal stress protein [Constantimarinum furrinae]QNJ99073.1 Universal stress protein [Constantimarinum furrinae]
MQQILIPTDFSDNAWNATIYALQFFKTQNITFHFLHIDISLQVDDELHYNGVFTKKEISKEKTANMVDWMHKINIHYPNPNHKFRFSIRPGLFIACFRNYVTKENIDLIVMGTKGASGLKEMTIGSKTGAVIKRIKCPNLVIPEEAQFTKPLNIGFPTDFNMFYKQRIIRTLLEIANTYQSSIKVLRVAQNEKPMDKVQKTNRKHLIQYLHEISHSFHVIDNPILESALQSFVNSMHIDMVAMIAKNLNFFQRLLFKPQVEQISYHMQIPFLVLHE